MSAGVEKIRDPRVAVAYLDAVVRYIHLLRGSGHYWSDLNDLNRIRNRILRDEVDTEWTEE